MADGARRAGRWKIYFEPRDQWVGRFVDPAARVTFWCLLPCLVLRHRWRPVDTPGPAGQIRWALGHVVNSYRRPS